MAVYSDNPIGNRLFIVLLQCFLILFGFSVGSTIAAFPGISQYQGLFLVWLLLFAPAVMAFLLPYYIFRDSAMKMGALLVFFLLLIAFMSTITASSFFNLQTLKPTSVQIATSNIQFYGFVVFVIASIVAEVMFIDARRGDFRRTSMLQEQKNFYANNRSMYTIISVIMFVAFTIYMSGVIYAAL